MRPVSTLAVTLTLLTVGLSTSFVAMAGVEPEPEHQFLPIAMLAQDPAIAARFAAEATPAGADAVASAVAALTTLDARGRTVEQWLDTADPARYLALRAPAAAAAPDLVAATARLHELVGQPLTAAERADVAAQAAALEPAVRDAFAAMVSATADAYAAQLPVADAILARWPADPLMGHELATMAERDAMEQTAEGVVAAANTLRDSLTLPMRAATPEFISPMGLVRLTDAGAGTHERISGWDPILHVDVGGDDTYLTSAGGACPDALNLAHACNDLALAVLVELGGDDSYHYDGPPAAVQAAGSIGGVGLLLEFDGNDDYFSRMVRTNSGPLFQYIDGGAQAFAQGGFALLLEADGEDHFEHHVESASGRDIWAFAQGFGSAGLGILADASLGGGDFYGGYGDYIANRNGFMGVYNNGIGFYGGVGIQTDVGGGDDRYEGIDVGITTDYYAQGFGAFAGVGILHDDAGDDSYYAIEDASDPWIVPLLNCAFGTASLGGQGYFLDISGNDRYYGDTFSPRAAETMNEGFGGIGVGYALFIDMAGDDEHLMYVHGAGGSFTAGRGNIGVGGNQAGNYLDLGGTDIYVGAQNGLLLPASRDDSVWVGGADLNVVPDVLAGVFA